MNFQLIVGDGQLSSTPATVNITVKHVNHPPVASVGPDQAVAESSLVMLDASASYDPDAEPLTYLWQQLSGPTVTLADPTQAKPTFLAPLVGPVGMTLSFKLTMSDGQASTEAMTNIHVTNVNHPPVAQAGPDQTRNAGTTVQLDGTASMDPDSDPLTFTWSQLSGPTVTLSNVHSATPTFVGPHVSISTTLTFQLMVDDGLGGTAHTDVNITLLPVDAPPLCTHAQAYPQLLWPPHHKLADIKIVGVTDPDSRKVTVTVTHVTQDEPVGCIARRGSRDYCEDDDETRGCRHTTPDAIIHPDGHVALRAERRAHVGTGACITSPSRRMMARVGSAPGRSRCVSRTTGTILPVWMTASATRRPNVSTVSNDLLDLVSSGRWLGLVSARHGDPLAPLCGRRERSDLHPLPSPAGRGCQRRLLLHAVVAHPFTTFADVELYPTDFDKAAALLHSLIKSHPFLDGTKRMAFAAKACF